MQELQVGKQWFFKALIKYQVASRASSLEYKKRGGGNSEFFTQSP